MMFLKLHICKFWERRWLSLGTCLQENSLCTPGRGNLIIQEAEWKEDLWVFLLVRKEWETDKEKPWCYKEAEFSWANTGILGWSRQAKVCDCTKQSWVNIQASEDQLPLECSDKKAAFAFGICPWILSTSLSAFSLSHSPSLGLIQITILEYSSLEVDPLIWTK